jgi:hypothetical protein
VKNKKLAFKFWCYMGFLFLLLASVHSEAESIPREVIVVSTNYYTGRVYKNRSKVFNPQGLLLKTQAFPKKQIKTLEYNSQNQVIQEIACKSKHCTHRNFLYYPHLQIVNTFSFFEHKVSYTKLSKRNKPTSTGEWLFLCPQNKKKCKKKIKILDSTEVFQYSESGFLLKKKRTQYKNHKVLFFEKVFYEYDHRNRRIRQEKSRNGRLLEKRIMFYKDDELTKLEIYKSENTSCDKKVVFKDNQIHSITYYAQKKIYRVDRYQYRYW